MNATELFWAWADACMAKEVDTIADLYCRDATHAFPFRDGAPVIEGREAIRRHLAEGLGKAPVSFSGVKHAFVHHTEDPHTVIVECTFDGTLSSTGVAFQPSYVEVLTERDGLIGAVLPRSIPAAAGIERSRTSSAAEPHAAGSSGPAGTLPDNRESELPRA